jgi:hypothetical protein
VQDEVTGTAECEKCIRTWANMLVVITLHLVLLIRLCRVPSAAAARAFIGHTATSTDLSMKQSTSDKLVRNDPRGSAAG